MTTVGTFALTEMFAGQAIVGACVSCTVTVKLQEPVIELEQVTVVIPTLNVLPEAGVQVTVPQLPDVVGAEYVTTAEHDPVVFGTVMFAGQVNVQLLMIVSLSVAELLPGVGSVAPPAVATVAVLLKVPVAAAESVPVAVNVTEPPTGKLTVAPMLPEPSG